jgi:hypothetical protein
VDNLAAIQHVIKNEEGYYYGEFIPSRFQKIDVYAIDKFTRRIKQKRRSPFECFES